MATILIIDDDEALRSVIRRILERSGHLVKEAPDGIRGLALFDVEPVDAVITDLFMPEKEGIETIIELRERSARVRILAISGGARFGPDEPLTDARLLGADAVLAKPFSVEELSEAMEALLG